MSSTNPTPDGGQQAGRPQGIGVYAPNTKLINLVIHDTGQGMGHWSVAPDSEIYGCLIYYNGNSSLDHGIYAQNQTGYKTIKDNIIFSNYSHGIHVYSSASALNNFRVEGNTSFQNGARNALVGSGDGLTNNLVFTANSLYRYNEQGVSDLDVGYSAGCTTPTITNNYIAQSTYLVNCTAGLTMTGNTFYGLISGFSPSSYPTNTYLSSRPTGIVTFVRPNQYEPGRANITVFNWDLAPTVNVDLAGVLTVGSSYEIRNAQDFFGAPVLTGTYAGGTLPLPMSGLSVEIPVGVAAPPATGPEFNAFVLLSTGVGRTAPSAPESVRPKTRTLDPRS
jgi:hypothetical protein